ncbi:hypothetical protein [Mucilaginibacter ginsenosidivorax]|uniref:Uncharacterized protein n=1 Tax=Mucilaginibacter ginsenosidivorax TaxID=862126 RepID=A0A5B8VYM7_9SPHI|nr:hypothetical protein [Mucilaginibacter ginsenosidivorax]QEC76534.1 hypothetical protein FSB76_11455 [Mucilaginibacter ginsenosidivorax]
MKQITGCLLTAMLFASCNNDAQQKVIDVFRPALANIKPVTAKKYGFGEGFCGQNIYLNSDSTFTWVHACEGQSSSSIGKWQVAGDSVLLTPYPQKADNISYRVSLSKSIHDSRVVIIITDKTGTPVKDFVILPFNNKPAFTFTNKGVMMGDKSYKLSYFQDNMSTDSTGTIRLLKSEKDSLDFSKLYALTGKTFRISTSNLPDTIRLTININGVAFTGYQVRYLADRPQKFRYAGGDLILKK